MWRGTGGGSLGEKGAAGVWEAGEQGAGSGILKVAGSRRNWGKLHNIVQNFAIEKKHKEVGANKNRAGTGI